MDPTLLRCFVTMARLGHLGQAAITLHISKSAIRYHLKELNSAVKQRVFKPSANGMQLTTAGRQLLPAAQRALKAMDEFTNTMQHIDNRLSGHAELGLVSDAIWLRAPQVLGLLHRHHPDLVVRLRQISGGTVQRDVLEGRLTAGWVLGPVDEPGLATRNLATVPLRVVGPRAWARQLETASLAELADFPWVDTLDRCGLAMHRQALFTQAMRSPTCQFHADSERAVYGIVAEGLAVSLLRQDLALSGQEAGDLALWPGTVPDLHLRFVIPTIRRDEPLGQAIVDAVMRAWGHGRPHEEPRSHAP